VVVGVVGVVTVVKVKEAGDERKLATATRPITVPAITIGARRILIRKKTPHSEFG
jgi:hypothetical protein